jgi:hypothetical protein
MLAVLRAALPMKVADPVVGVQIQQCRKGYARVLAVPSNVRCGQARGSCYDKEPVILKAAGRAWTYLDSGTGVSCRSPVPAKDIEACTALMLS